MVKVKFLSKFVAVMLVVSVCFSSAASAQGRRGGGFGSFFGGRGAGGASALQLAGREEVQKELKIGEEQRGIIRELQRDARLDFRAFGQLRDLSREERDKKFAELRKQAEKKTKDAEADLFGVILDEDQAQRLKEIVLQQKGVRALADAATAKAVGLSAAQTAKIKQAVESGDKKRRELFGRGRGGRPGRGDTKKKKGDTKKKKSDGGDRKKSQGGFRERFEKLRKQGEKIQQDTDKTVLALLTTDQKAKFEQLKGKKFDLPRRQFRNRGRSRPGQRGKRPPSEKKA